MADESKNEPQQFPNFPLNITIKQEKPSPKRPSVADEPANGEHSNGIFASNQEDSKSSLSLDPPPLKSSDEILAELFGVFNAEVPEILVGSDVKHSKSKKSKKEKKQKKIKEEPKSGDEGTNSDSESSDDFDIAADGSKTKKVKKKKKRKKKSREGSVDSKGEKKKKHKKHKKNKIKKEKTSDVEEGEIRVKKEKEKSEEKEKKKSKTDKDSKEDLRDLLKSRKHTNRDRSREHDSVRKDVKEKPKIQIKSLVNSTILKDAIKAADDRYRNRERDSRRDDRKRKKSESDISLSDEEDGRTSKRYRNPFSNPIKSEISSRSNRFYDGYYESYRHGRRRSRSRSYDRRRRRSRSRSGNRLDIDKKQLLEIARKNAIQMLKNGTLPGVQSLAQETKDKLMVKVKYGGKSVAELTDYCKKLSNGEIGDSDISDVDSEVEERAFHHPFELKDYREPIIMNIRNSVPIQPKSANEKKELLKLFPVSSGQEHRKTELEWVPVTPPPAAIEAKAPLAAIMPAPTAAPIVPLLNPQPQAPPKAVEPLPVPAVATTTTDKNTDVLGIKPLDPPPLPPSLPSGNPQVDLEIANSWKSSDFGLAGSSNAGPTVFNQPAQDLDVSQIITMRLDAMRRLQDNPSDIGAQRVLEDTQNNMSAWASSKYTPGQFLGSTGANLLSAKELAGWGNKAYAKKDTLTSTKPVDSGMGMHLLQKMGWRPGEGLGKDKSGSLQPLLLEVKNDRRGLVAGNENSQMRKSIKRPLRMNLEGKHPVSVLGEIAAKRKWGVPQFDVATEQGPGHAKLFVYKVRINGMEYQPAIASNTKKEAKAVAAKFCLQQMGILPT